MTLRLTFLVVGALIALAGWLLLCFDAVYLASFPLTRLGAAFPGTLAIVEAVVVGLLANQYRKDRLIHVGGAVTIVWLFNIANVVFVIFFWGGL